MIAEPAWAHHVMGGKLPQTFLQGLLSGFGHPVIGIDHLAAIVGVGILAALERFGNQVEWHTLGEGFTWETQDRTRDVAAAERAWAKARELMANPAIRLVVLDELNITLRYDHLAIADVVAALKARRADQHVVVTGRNAKPSRCRHRFPPSSRADQMADSIGCRLRRSTFIRLQPDEKRCLDPRAPRATARMRR